MSTVYKAQHLFLHRDVAVKVMQERWAANAEGRMRFQREAQATASLNHPNIVTVTEFGVAESGEPYMVMDYVRGDSLSQLLKEEDRAEPGQALSIFMQVASGLQHAHEKGILHRDLKPSNVMLTRSTKDNSLQVKVVDLGLARFLPHADRDQRRLTAAGELVGSPFYMSPEQIRDEELDARSDIYSFGCLMYETLTGVRPFNDTNAISVLSMHLYEAAPPFSAVLQPCKIPPRLEGIVLKCLEKSRSSRFQTMAQLLTDLEQVTPWVEAPDAKPTLAVTNGTVNSISTGSKRAAEMAQKADNAGKVANPEPVQQSRSPELSQVTGTIDLKEGYTLRLKQPDFARNKFLDILRRLLNPLFRMIEPHFRKFMLTFEGRGPESRKQRVTNTRVLIASLGEAEDMLAETELDAAKYKVYYKNVELRKGLNAQEFLVLLSTDQFEVIHLHGKFDKRGTFKDSTGFMLRLSDVKRACDYAQVKLLWLASENNLAWVKDNPVLTSPSFHLILTGARGNNFPKFLSSLLSRFSRGESISSAWEQFVPNAQYKGDKVNCRYVEGCAEIAFLP